MFDGGDGFGVIFVDEIFVRVNCAVIFDFVCFFVVGSFIGWLGDDDCLFNVVVEGVVSWSFYDLGIVEDDVFWGCVVFRVFCEIDVLDK